MSLRPDITRATKTPSVLILTGGVITPKEKSFTTLLKKQIGQWKESEHHWLELKVKATVGELLMVHEKLKRRWIKTKVWSKIRGSSSELHEFLTADRHFQTPELTEVSLATLLADAEITYELATFDDMFSDEKGFEAKMNRCEVVFLSSTFIRDLSELMPFVRKLKRSGNRIIVGGALMGTIQNEWMGDPNIDLIAVGYGEFLVPSIADWIKSGFKELKAPPTGRMEKKGNSYFLFSGTPGTLSLDFIQRPDWARAEADRDIRYQMINYESVRGCPYRCAFCNYPYLFDDQKFRHKSAKKIAADWLAYKNELPELQYITCLDSLFTMPKPRLLELCQILIENGSPIKWVCYARADDLADEKVVQMMVKAGCIQVQIGIESGHAQILKNMNKRTNVEINGKALDNCRLHGLTSVVTLIVGFPGETEETVRATFDFLKAHPSDFHFIATFSTRVQNVPILSPENKTKFDLVTMNNLYTVSPYWRHATMDCQEATLWSRWLGKEIVQNRVSVDAASFYRGLLTYQPEFREWLLDFQVEAWKESSLMRLLLDRVHKWIDKKLVREMDEFKLANPTPSQSP